ncbi:phage holin [Pseudoramibacter alactolyticus]|uniref:phage holin n=1 Tax=Pseudoramibacter alactolyticus TaxID=113287 RepID=UPI0028EBD8CE|nr:phage holin [Pseudoramibacter alactolyticus]
MKMNLKLRLKNKATLTALIAACVAFAYQLCGIFGIVPAVGQDAVIQALGLIVNVLAALGVVVDPTTKGIGDSTRAMTYEKPADDQGVA